MSEETDRLEAELEVMKLAEEAEDLRDAAYAKNASADDIKAFKEAIQEVANARTAFKEKYAPLPPAEEDAAATPKTISASSSVQGKKRGDTA